MMGIGMGELILGDELGVSVASLTLYHDRNVDIPALRGFHIPSNGNPMNTGCTCTHCFYLFIFPIFFKDICPRYINIP